MITKILKGDEASLEEAAQFIKNHEVVAFPTETVYGLGASIYSEKAVKKIYQVKGRDFSKPLAMLINSIDQATEIGELTEDFAKLAQVFFPGPLTIIVKKRGEDTIGIRMPNHNVALQLIEKVGHPIFATSANLSNEPSGINGKDVYRDFSTKIAAVIEGNVDFGIESTVLSLVDENHPKLLRLGKIAIHDLESVIQKKIMQN